MGDGAITLYEERVRALTSSLPIALYIAEPSADFRGPRLLGAAIGEALGFRRHDFQSDGQLWVSRIHPDDLRNVQEAASNAGRTGLLSIEYRWRCADDGERLFLDRGIVACAPGSPHKNLIGVCLDMTDQEKLLALLRRYGELGITAIPEESALPKDVLHDVNNLLTVIIWNLERSVWRMEDDQSPQAKWVALQAALTPVLMSPRASAVATGNMGIPPGSERVVLVVEDDFDVRAATLARLEDMGYRVLEADSARSALDILTAGKPIDLMLTDINLPGDISGLDLSHRAARLQPRLKLLFASGGRPPRDVEHELNGEVLLKPYRREELAAAIARTFARVSPARQRQNVYPRH